MASAKSSWSEKKCSCSVCHDVFKSPVSTPCGHNFCRDCINTSRDDEDKFKCPFCQMLVHKISDLRVNTLLSEMVAQLRKIESEDQQMIQERKRMVQEIKDAVTHTKEDADRVIAILMSCFSTEVEMPVLEPAVKKCTEMEKLPDLRSTLKKYECELTLDTNSAHRELALSEDNRKVTRCSPGHLGSKLEKFDYHHQVLCREGLTDRCYWEVEREGYVGIGVTYRGITRIGRGDESCIGWNNKSWNLYCHGDRYTVRYNNSETVIGLLPSNRVGVYVDRPAGSLSFYRVSPDGGGSSDTLTHIHTFQSTFTQEDLLPAFAFWNSGSSVSLCRL